MNIDATTGALAGKIKSVLERRYGDGLAAVYVFGSRARGEHQADSDLDLAVVLRQVEQPLGSIDVELLDLTYTIEIEHGLHIQLWALPAESISADETDPSAAVGLRARLAATIRREGIRL
ncbi:MAG TPA: nucleotidyltransferase domain-containing protein [Rhizomicrobium sp.]